ncbi:hypothetical protein M407DRAFT_18421 [Tulasnella calospora MUT 4182]|uniref:F-box domain-containing protein n=1 Tax=Tulasnella calospora MUT 4182 TaxID=1051891 RepID=A0A0C3MG03_9AGAM|nr:hypothetical protein M407DRAFT_18421 [Tulasnella calospora MUT 4182]
MPVTGLPAELIIRILSHTPIQTIISLSLTSLALHDLITANENTIYHAAAKFHGFVQTPQGSPASQALEREIRKCGMTGWLDDVRSWKELCRRHFLLEYSWTEKLGDCDLPVKFLWPSTLSRVYQFAIDRLEHTAICSSISGGLIVAAIDTGEQLWQLPSDYVARYAHIEHDHGFLIFPRGHDHLEVWRRSTDHFSPESHLPSWPHPSQIAVSPYAAATPEDDSLLPAELSDGDNFKPKLSTPLRGVYLPFALLPVPTRARVFCLAHPYLVAASETTKRAYIWDVTHATLIRMVDISMPSLRILDRTYSIDTRAGFSVICWTRTLAVYQGIAAEESPGSLPEVIFAMDWEHNQPAALRREPPRSSGVRFKDAERSKASGTTTEQPSYLQMGKTLW